MRSSKHLLDLPAELHAAIAEFLDNPSLLAFRLTHSNLESNSVEAFGRRFFSQRTHVATNHSLHVLRSITASPTLVRYIESVDIVAVGVAGGYDRTLDIPGAYPPAAGGYDPWREEHDDTTGVEHSGVLNDIFTNLHSAGRVQALTITNLESHFAAHGVPSKLEFDDMQPSTMDIVRATHGLPTYIQSVRPWAQIPHLSGQPGFRLDQLALKALIKSGLRPEKLELETDFVDGTERSAITLSSDELDTLRDLGNHVEVLQLALTGKAELPPSFEVLLSSARNLRCLYIVEIAPRALPQLSKIINPEAKLENIMIQAVDCRSATFISFIRPFKSTLRSLTIGDFEGYECDEFFEMLLCEMELENLKLLNFQLFDEDDIFKAGELEAGSGAWTAEGREEVDGLLQKLLEYLMS